MTSSDGFSFDDARAAFAALVEPTGDMTAQPQAATTPKEPVPIQLFVTAEFRAPSRDDEVVIPPEASRVVPVFDPTPRVRPKGGRRVKDGERWEDRHVRRTFHLPVGVSEALDAEVNADEDLSLAAAVTEALDAWLRRREMTRKTGGAS